MSQTNKPCTELVIAPLIDDDEDDDDDDDDEVDDDEDDDEQVAGGRDGGGEESLPVREAARQEGEAGPALQCRTGSHRRVPGWWRRGPGGRPSQTRQPEHGIIFNEMVV